MDHLCNWLQSSTAPPAQFWELVQLARQDHDGAWVERLCRAYGAPIEPFVEHTANENGASDDEEVSSADESTGPESDGWVLEVNETYRTTVTNNQCEEDAYFLVTQSPTHSAVGQICWFYTVQQVAEHFECDTESEILSGDLDEAYTNGCTLLYHSNHFQTVTFDWVAGLPELEEVSLQLTEVLTPPASGHKDETGPLYVVGTVNVYTNQISTEVGNRIQERRAATLRRELLACGSARSPIQRRSTEWERAVSRIETWRFHEIEPEEGICAACGMNRRLTFALQPGPQARRQLKLGKRCQSRLHWAYILATHGVSDDLLDDAHTCLAEEEFS